MENNRIYRDLSYFVLSQLLPVNILNKGNVELSWIERRLVVGEYMKARRIMIVFSY